MLYDRFKCLLCSIIQNCQKQRHSNLCKLEVLTSLLQPSSTATTWWWRSREKKGFSLPACFMFCHKVVQTQVQTCWRSSNLWHHETPSQHQVMQSPSKQRSLLSSFTSYLFKRPETFWMEMIREKPLSDSCLVVFPVLHEKTHHDVLLLTWPPSSCFCRA